MDELNESITTMLAHQNQQERKKKNLGVVYFEDAELSARYKIRLMGTKIHVETFFEPNIARECHPSTHPNLY